jgi:transcriptional regulator with XRE-family HTH domain
MNKTPGERIKFLRELKGWHQEALAQKIGISREALSGIENNHRQVKANELGCFADELGVSSDQLLGRIPLDEVNLEKLTPLEVSKEGMRISVPAKNVQKFREVLLYVLNKVGAKSNISETVLYKLLYFIDFDFYEKYEEQLMGATYRKNKFGPSPVEFAEIVHAMTQDEDITRVKGKYFNKEQKKYLPLRKPLLDCFSAKEITLIDEVLNRLSDKNASQISEYSHGDIPWKVTKDMEVINYETVFYRTPEYSVRSSEDE